MRIISSCKFSWCFFSCIGNSQTPLVHTPLQMISFYAGYPLEVLLYIGNMYPYFEFWKRSHLLSYAESY